MYNTGHYVQSMPKSVTIQKLALAFTCINQEISRQKTYLYAILWKTLTFIKFCGDHYDIYENEKKIISNASWEILDRTFSTEFQSKMEVSKLPWLQKKEYQEWKEHFFIDNVKHMFVLSILQTVSGTSTPIKGYCIF